MGQLTMLMAAFSTTEFGIGFPEFSYCYPISGGAVRTKAPFWNLFRAKGLKVI